MSSCKIPAQAVDVTGDGRWISMHNRYVNEAKTCEPDVIFIGDSIIQQLQFSDLWDKISSLHCLNFGIGGDRVENVLWRLQNGELECSSTVKIIVLFVGTNNYNSKAEEIVEGIEECIQVIRKKLGHCHIVIPTLLPRGQTPNKLRDLNNEVNTLLLKKFRTPIDSKPELEQNIHIVEIHNNIIQSDGTISHYLLHDYLHLTNAGYTKIFTPVYEKLCELLNKVI
ncbi:platelet-activating factor acetylhydrolase IB subunit alpha2-like [Chrysoperla carnea]|uniref:platelet-activating factor acetylhydrolase IB subunit alpha2-like n=1 Tax=Chrysoperla carnea TaxID=189513 RepID=UPI001D062A52|nr:platelet-activating factor acetylhydrolase IB subunit alpha2-like [Chrysoperla carnea]